MNDIQIISGIHGYLDSKNTAWLNAEDVAKGFGFTQEKNGVEYVRWETINNYLKGFGFSQRVGKEDYLPENMVYRLGFKANNETAVRFQTILADEVLPSIRRTGTYISPNAATNAKLQDAEVKVYLIEAISRNLRLNDASRLGMYQSLADEHNLQIPAYVPSIGLTKSAKDLLKDINSPLSAIKFNLLLEAQGYVQRMTRPSTRGTVRKFWSITDKGKSYGENKVSPKNQNETQPHWYVDKFKELYDIVTENS